MSWPEWTFGIEYAVASAAYGVYAQHQSYQKRAVSSNEIPAPNRNKPVRSAAKRNGNEEEKKANDMVREMQDTIKAMEKTEREKEKKIKELERDLEIMKKKYTDREEQYIQMERRSTEITREMSRLTEARGNFENVNDEFANSNLARRFESLYANKWVFLAKWLSKAFPSIHELERILFLTSIMKFGYEKCAATADDALCVMFQVEKLKDIPPDEDLSELITLRRRFAVRDSTRNRIKQTVSESVFRTEDVNALCSGGNGSTLRKKLQEFLNEYLDCIWLLSVSNPPVELNFNVVGKPYTECQDHFSTYSTKKPVEDLDRVEGTVYAVVWPCMQLSNDSAIYVKGDVVVVKKGKRKEVQTWGD